MTIDRWSESIIVADLQDDPHFTDDMNSLFDEMDAQRNVNVVANIAGVTYLNSSNLAKLLKLRKKLIANKQRLVLAGIDTNVWGLFLVTGLDKVFEFAENVATALASVQMTAGE